MTFQRKEYQETALGFLKTYLETARVHGAKSAFERVTKEIGQARTYKELAPLPETPYICLRIPTGGGKTYMAARSASIATCQKPRTWSSTRGATTASAFRGPT